MTRRWFVPVATLLLVCGGGHWVATHMAADLLRGGQNVRLTFQDPAAAASAGLDGREVGLANAVLDRDRRPVTPGHTELLYLGNSQTLAIMDRKPGDLTAPQWLQVLLARRGAPVDVRL